MPGEKPWQSGWKGRVPTEFVRVGARLLFCPHEEIGIELGFAVSGAWFEGGWKYWKHLCSWRIGRELSRLI